MTTVAIIPARGGSKRIPRKNVRMFHGKPIIAYSIAVALESELFDGVYVSTEDDEIASVARAYGAEIIHRPPELAEIGAPDCGTQEVTRHAIQMLGGVRLACCIYPCAPLIRVKHLYKGLQRLIESRRPFWYADGHWYWGRGKDFVDRTPLGWTGTKFPDYVDINTEEDWLEAEKLYAQRAA